ncbi:MAG: hypothetical protein ABR915_08325 [Thermoguttaceae bacterium]|jgi:HEAT repeat protein
MDTILKELNLDKAMTREDAASNREVIAKLVAAGPKAVEHLVNRLADNGDPTAQVALHAMAFAVGAPGKEEHLKGFVDALAAQLQRDLPQGTKYFLIEQLQLTGGRQAVPAIAANLGENALADPASRALTRIGGPDAAAALREALPKAKGRARLSIMQALTDLGDRQSLDEFRKTAKDENRDARVLALFSLADLGDASSTDLVLGSVDGKPRFERMQNFRAALRLAQRLKEAGKASEAKRVYQEVLKRCTGDHESHVKQAAARGLLMLAGGQK